MAPDRPRRWQFYQSPKTIRGDVVTPRVCQAQAEGPPYPLVTSQFHQAAGGVLVDAGLNFVVYDTRVNKPVERHVADRPAGETSPAPVLFPDGYYMDRNHRFGGV